MSHADWVSLFAPAVGAIALALAGLLVALLTGLTSKISAYFTAHDNAAAAQVANSLNATIAKEVETSASVLAGKIDRGELDYTNREAWRAQAISEVALIKARLPAAAQLAVEQGTPLLVQLMARVDSKAVASPTINAPVAPTPIVVTKPI